MTSPDPVTLAYHRISRWPLPAGTWVTPRQLGQHLDAVAATGRPHLTADDFLAKLPGVLHTFDDGTADLFAHRDLLQCRGLKPVVFVPVDFIGRWNRWEWPVPGRATQHLDRDQLRQLVDLGWEIGLHGSSHRPLTGLPEAELQAEIEEGKMRLENLTGCRARLFSYPFGLVDEAAAAAVARAGFAAAFVLGAGSSAGGGFRLPRRPVYCIDSAQDVKAKIGDPSGKTWTGRWQLWKEAAAHGVGRGAARFIPGRRPVPAGSSSNPAT